MFYFVMTVTFVLGVINVICFLKIVKELRLLIPPDLFTISIKSRKAFLAPFKDQNNCSKYKVGASARRAAHLNIS